MTEWTVNNKLNAWYQKQYHIKLPKQYQTKALLYFTTAYAPSALFSLGEQGVWFDPSDVANLNWRRNLLTYTEQFDNAAWTKDTVTISANSAVAPDGTTTADTITGVSGSFRAYQFVPTVIGATYTMSIYVKQGTSPTIRCDFINVTAGPVFTFSTASWSVVSGFTTTVQSVGDGWFRISATAVSSSAGSGPGWSVSGTTTALIWGAQLELGSTATDYQRITDVNTEVIERFPTATLYQDPAGTTPVTTTGQSVGLMLDKSRGLALGPELVVNGDFSSGLTSWVSGASAIGTLSGGGVLVERNDGTSVNTGIQQAGVTTGLTYVVEFDILSGSGTLLVNETFNVTISPGRRRYVYVGTAANIRFQARCFNGGSAVIDNISVKLLPGNHAVQATTAARPFYGIHPVGGRRNLLTWTEQFDNAAWVRTGVATVTTNAAVAPDGTMTAEKVTVDSSTGFHRVASGAALAVSPHTFSAYFKSAEYTLGALSLFDGAAFTARATFDLSAGTVAVTNGSATITAAGNGWYRCTVTGNGSATANAFISVNSAFSFTGDGTSGILIWGAQLETGSTATNYQRVTDQYNVTEAGVSSVSYLFFDGADSMATPSINFATATSDGQARRNLLTFPTAFDDAAWTKSGAGTGSAPTVTANAGIAPDGTMTADRLDINRGAGNTLADRSIVSQALTASDNVAVSGSIYLKAATSGDIGKTIGVRTASASAYVEVTLTADWVRFTNSGTTTARTLEIESRGTISGSNSVSLLAWGAQLETGTTASAFQNIGTDKMTVFAGVRKLSDAATGMVVELSASSSSNNGTMWMIAPLSSGVADANFTSKGTILSGATRTGFAAPVTAVMAGLGDISGDRAVLRINSAETVTTNDQGTGTYGNYPLYIGARNSASLFFSGHLYSLIVRGAQSTADQISGAESWVAGQTGFFAPVISGGPTVGVS
jgi:hypothetical protein